jgi:hypothetical protein
MALEQVVCKIGLKALADLSAKQFYALQLVSGTDYGCTLATAATYKPGGVLQNKPTLNKAADSMFVGITKAVAGGTIHVGDRVASHTDGTFVVTVTAKDFTWGISLTEASAGDVFSFFVNIGGGRDSGN